MKIMEAIQEMPVIDNHSHAGWLEAIVGNDLDLEELLNMFPKADLLSRLPDAEYREILKKPDGFRPFEEELREYQRSRVNITGERLQVEAYREFYGHRGDSVLGSDGQALTEAIREQRSKGREANYEMAFTRSRIERALVNDVELHLDLPRFVSWVPYLDPFVFVKDNSSYRDERYQLARAMVRYETALVSSKSALGADPRTLEDFLEFVDASLGRFRKIGCPAMKVHCGYVRTLRFEDVPRSAAENLFQKENLSKEEYGILQDFLMRFAMKRCGVHGLPVLVHAAMGGPMPGLILSNANCVNLQNLFLDDEFRLVRFVILHGGYPFVREAGYLASTHINVYLDFSWLTFFFQSTLERIIEEWLEFVPYTKLIFGTDAWSPELHWCGVTSGKHTLARVLERGPWSADLSLKMARAILRDNAARLYGW